MAQLLKKLLVVLAVITLSTSMAYAGEKVRVTFGAEPYPPFTVPDASGNWTGWEIEMIEAICTAAGLDYELVPTAWDGIIPALISKKVDLIIGSMSITEERLKSIDFSEKYFNTPAYVVGAKGMKFEATPAGLKGKVLGVQTATTHAAYAAKHYKDSKIKQYQTQDEINQDLISGRLDATQADSLAMIDFLETADGQSCCDLKGAAIDDPAVLGRGVGVGMRKGSDEMKAKINAAIKTIRANGKYQEITKKYFKVDVYGE
ncbi:MAG: transporter substrate-binding domain-containing protein [Desulfobacterales bacterium]|nr:transporter substrate-binding domain-containing protein [Desulfobacterales bacterium]